LTLYKDSLASGFLLRKDEIRNLESQQIKVKRLDDLLEEINFFDSNSKTLLKIDTEGFELDVLKGSEKLLSSDCLKYIQLEVRLNFIETYNPSDIFVKLQKYGFVFSRIDKVAFRKNGISYIDMTFEKLEV